MRNSSLLAMLTMVMLVIRVVTKIYASQCVSVMSVYLHLWLLWCLYAFVCMPAPQPQTLYVLLCVSASIFSTKNLFSFFSQVLLLSFGRGNALFV